MTKLDAPLPIETEIRQEKARALGRTGRAFEQELERLRAFELHCANVSSQERATLQLELQAIRKQVMRRLWYLVVHREAIGLRHHDGLYEAYRIPRSLVPNP